MGYQRNFFSSGTWQKAKIALTCFGILTGLSQSVSAKGNRTYIPYEKYRLENGLEVILHQDETASTVAVSMWTHVGALHETQGRSGFAHLFEHLMFQGSPHVADDKHFYYLQQAGAKSINGTTSFDRTNYFEVVPAHELELALWLESDRFGWLMETVDQAKLDEQREVVKNERLQRVDNQPYGLAEEKVWQSMFPSEHPYFGRVIGSLSDLGEHFCEAVETNLIGAVSEYRALLDMRDSHDPIDHIELGVRLRRLGRFLDGITGEPHALMDTLPETPVRDEAARQVLAPLGVSVDLGAIAK